MSTLVKIVVGIVMLVVLFCLLAAAWHFLLGAIVFLAIVGGIALLVRRWHRAKLRSRPSDLHHTHEAHHDADESLKAVKSRLDDERRRIPQ